MDSLVQKSVPGWWEILRGERVGFKSLLGSPSPIPDLCVVAKNEMGTTEHIFFGLGWGVVRKLQMANVCRTYVQQRLLSSQK